VHLIEEAAARIALDKARNKWRRTDDAWDAATWVVLRDPEYGIALNEAGSIRSFTYVGAKSIDMPDVTIIYEVRNDTTIILDALFKDATYTQSGTA
jgi:hypothetical protein